MIEKYKKINILFFGMLIIFFSLLPIMAFRAPLVGAATAGCYKIESGVPVQLTCPTSGAIYDDSSGANILRPDPVKCYIYSANLYDGDSSWGDPYVEVNCATLSACPSGQELRYSNDKVGPPDCVATTEATSGVFAGGATPANQGSGEGNKAVETNCEPGTNPSTGKVEQLSSGNCGIVKYLVTGINFLSAIAGMAIIFSIMFAGFQYMTAQDNPQAISAAKYRIIWAVVALMMLLFTYAGLDFLVPGGVL